MVLNPTTPGIDSTDDEPGPAFLPGEAIPPGATGVPIVGDYRTDTPDDPSLSEVAHEIEEEVEEKAAMGFLGGPVVWGLLAIIAVALVYFIGS